MKKRNCVSRCNRWFSRRWRTGKIWRLGRAGWWGQRGWEWHILGQDRCDHNIANITQLYCAHCIRSLQDEVLWSSHSCIASISCPPVHSLSPGSEHTMMSCAPKPLFSVHTNVTKLRTCIVLYLVYAFTLPYNLSNCYTYKVQCTVRFLIIIPSHSLQSCTLWMILFVESEKKLCKQLWSCMMKICSLKDDKIVQLYSLIV